MEEYDSDRLSIRLETLSTEEASHPLMLNSGDLGIPSSSIKLKNKRASPKKENKVAEMRDDKKGDTKPIFKILKKDKITWENFDEFASEFILDDSFKGIVEKCATWDIAHFVYLTKMGRRHQPVHVTGLSNLYDDVSVYRNLVKTLVEDWEKKDEHGKDVINEGSLHFLEAEHIKALRKESPSFPDALYYCQLCDYHLNNMDHIRTHLEESSHFSLRNLIDERKQFVNMSFFPLPKQKEAINNLLKEVLNVSKVYYIDGNNISLLEAAELIRNQIFNNISDIPELKEKNIKLHLIGSLYYNVHDDDSDINLSLKIDNIQPDLMFETVRTIESKLKAMESDGFCDMEICEGLHPRFIMKYKDITVMILWQAENKVAVTRLFRMYTVFNKKVPLLMKAVRHWAKKAELIFPIGLVKEAYDLMVIHYLQDKKILPIISHQDLQLPTEHPKDFDLAEEFIGFFGYYSCKRDTVVQIEKEKMLKEEWKWNKKLFQIKDPYRDDNIVNYGKTVQPFFFNCILKTYTYFVIPRNEDGPIVEIQLYSPQQEENEIRRQNDIKRQQAKQHGQMQPMVVINSNLDSVENTTTLKKPIEALIKKNTSTVSAKMDDNYQMGMNSNEDPVSFINSQIVLTPSKRSCKMEKQLFSSMRECSSKMLDNDANEIADQNSEAKEKDYIYTTEAIKLIGKEAKLSLVDKIRTELEQNCIIDRTNKRFLQPEKSSVDLFPYYNRQGEYRQNILDDTDTIEHKDYVDESEVDVTAESNIYYDALGSPMKEYSPNVKILTEIVADDLHHNNKEAITRPVMNRREEKLEYKRSKGRKQPVAYDEFRIRHGTWPIKWDPNHKAGTWSPEDFCYSFDDINNFTHGFCADVKCQYCDKNSHLSANCPEMKIPDIIEITHQKSHEEWIYLNMIIKRYYDNQKLDDNYMRIIDNLIDRMKQFLIKDEYLKDSTLEVFGSLHNGFGTKGSDVDICFKFNGHSQPPEGIDAESIIKSISKVLNRNMKGIKIEKILNAKVPIVKFELPGEIVIDGDISYYNTLALSNTKMLHTYTRWDARVAQLGLWVKKWAKHCDIGDASRGSLSSYSYIIMLIHYLQNCDPPVLPRLQEDFRENKPPELANEWDVYYHKEVEQEWSQNKKSVAELFIGFLDYYSRFDYKNMVIQIRRSTPLTKLEKGWSRSICLEDPFDLRHNLGSGVTQRMFVYIVKTIRLSRGVFMSPINVHEAKEDFILNKCGGGKVPVKVCYLCHRLGHFRENCPKRNENQPSPQRRREGFVRRENVDRNAVDKDEKSRENNGKSNNNNNNSNRHNGRRRDRQKNNR